MPSMPNKAAISPEELTVTLKKQTSKQRYIYLFPIFR